MIIPAFIFFARTIHITGYVYYDTPFLKVGIVDYYVQHNIRKHSRMNYILVVTYRTHSVLFL